MTNTNILKIKEEMENILGKEVIIQEVKKNNGTIKTGVSIKSENDVYPVLYLEDFIYGIEKLEDVDIQWVAHKIISEIKNHLQEARDFSYITEKINKYENVREDLRIALINTETNEGLLKDLVSEKFMDLSQIVIIQLDGATIKVNNKMLEMWGKTEMKVLQDARNNTINEMPLFNTMANTLFGLSDGMSDKELEDIIEESKDHPMYVLTNKIKHYGAAMMLQTNTLDRIAKAMETDVVHIIPSSIHEVIIIPSTEMSIGELSDMIKDINAGILETEEILAGHPYVYDVKTKEFSMQ